MADKKFGDFNAATEAHSDDITLVRQDKGQGAHETRKITLATIYQWIVGKLGTAATKDVGTNSGNVMEVGAFGLGMGPNHLDSFEGNTPNGFYRFHASSSNPPSGINPPAGVFVSGIDGTPRSAAVAVSLDNRVYGMIAESDNSVEVNEVITSKYLLSGTGQSTEYPMSQKAVTDELDKKNTQGTGASQTRTNSQNDGRFVLGQAGTDGAEFRNNSENDGRFAQLSGGDDADFASPPKVNGEVIYSYKIRHTGTATLNGTTDNTLELTDVVPTLDLAVGDVIRIEYSGYSKLHTVESIVDDDNIIVNYEHAGNRGDGSLRLEDKVSESGVTVSRICKWWNAPLGLGQAVVDVRNNRKMTTTYDNQTGRLIVVYLQDIGDSNTSNRMYIGGVLIGNTKHSYTAQEKNLFSLLVPSGFTYEFIKGGGNNDIECWTELR